MGKISKQTGISIVGQFLFIMFTLLLAYTSSLGPHPGTDACRQENSALNLPLHHVSGKFHSPHTSDHSFPFSKVLDLDEARVKLLNSRVTSNITAAHSVSRESGNMFSAKSVQIPVSPGNSIGVGIYYTEISLGTPPTSYPVVIDTGSSLSWVQCEPCEVYCHPQVGSPFNPSASTAYQPVTCASTQCSSLTYATYNSPLCTSSDVCMYNVSYVDQSISMGYLIQDSLWLGEGSQETLSDFVFGCGQNNDGLFGESAGLIGLAQNELSLVSQLSTKYGNAFSYCLPTATPLGQLGSGGFLSIGTTSTSTAYMFTPLLANSRVPSLYFLKLSTITLANMPLNVAPSEYDVPTIIDSGTTISRLSVYPALRDELIPIISSTYEMADAYSIFDACFKGTSSEVSSVLPDIKLVFQGGAELNLAPYNVVTEVEEGITCLAFARNLENIAIIGNHQQQTFEVFYDISNSRIGFAASGCS